MRDFLAGVEDILVCCMSWKPEVVGQTGLVLAVRQLVSRGVRVVVYKDIDHYRAHDEKSDREEKSQSEDSPQAGLLDRRLHLFLILLALDGLSVLDYRIFGPIILQDDNRTKDFLS